MFVDLISELRRTRGGKHALGIVWEYIFKVGRRPPDEMVEQLKAIVGEENAEELMNTAEQLIEKIAPVANEPAAAEFRRFRG